jgi:hypothetical protein
MKTEKIEILNTWTSNQIDKIFFDVDAPVYEKGDYRIFKQWQGSYLYTFKNIAINQLAGFNKEHIESVRKLERPSDPRAEFLYERALSAIERGNNLLNNK